ncbi:MAG: N-acetylmuramoyl-L-alanine amidase [Alphaproteobacteria bacterium]|nr:N-acetylmuramoyl-L-alanine amidase [Alphaproteobacteria bacterium]
MLAMLALPAIAARAVELKNATITEAGGHTVFEADVSAPVSFSVTAQEKPSQVEIDLPRLTFNLPRGAGREVAGSISSWRYGAGDKGKARIVLSTKTPVVISASTLVPPANGKPAHLKIDLVVTTRQGFAETKALETGSITPASPKPAAAKLVIALDPGHGGVDPGASSNTGTREKDVVLAFADALRTALEATSRYTVVMTRQGDKFIKLEDRVQYARDHKADLFIAIHADTLDEAEVRGTTLYTESDKASDAVAEAMAQKENRADILTGMDLGKQSEDVANVLINLAQKESRSQAMLFAKKAVNEIRPVTELTSKPIRSAAFVVLKAPDVPSVLVELGYLSNKADEAMLLSPQWRSKMAAAMTAAIDGYFSPSLSAALK